MSTYYKVSYPGGNTPVYFTEQEYRYWASSSDNPVDDYDVELVTRNEYLNHQDDDLFECGIDFPADECFDF